MNILNNLIAVILVMVFWSFAITTITYALPDTVIDNSQPEIFNSINGNFDITAIETDVTENLESQTNIPVIDIGSLVFYSGNLFLDLLLNFVTALPQMLGMFITGLNLILNVDSYYIELVQAVIMGLTTVVYIISIISFMLNIRSGRSIT
jgi:hypothetical protein